VTRAVIKLSGDISPLMPLLSKRIAGCAYHPEANLLAFRVKNMTVTVDARQINLFNVEDEAAAKTFMTWLVSIANNADR
jgi:ArsR family metal-binding transcriptional regulator